MLPFCCFFRGDFFFLKCRQPHGRVCVQGSATGRRSEQELVALGCSFRQGCQQGGGDSVGCAGCFSSEKSSRVHFNFILIFFFFFLLQPCMFSPKIPYAKLYFLQSSAIKPDKTSSLGYQISTCASKVYCSGGMHFITVVSKLNRLFYQLHSENNQKYIF